MYLDLSTSSLNPAMSLVVQRRNSRLRPTFTVRKAFYVELTMTIFSKKSAIKIELIAASPRLHLQLLLLIM